VKALEDALAAQRGHSPSYVLLFVGTKLLAQWTRPRTAELSPADVFLLSLYVKSALDPPPPPPAVSTVVPSEPDTGSHKPSDPEEVRARRRRTFCTMRRSTIMMGLVAMAARCRSLCWRGRTCRPRLTTWSRRTSGKTRSWVRRPTSIRATTTYGGDMAPFGRG